MGKSILVVEDDEDMRAWLKLHLSNAGYSVRCVENGKQAADACLTAKPDLIVSDLHMPGMGGLDMARILNSEKFLRNIPVIFLTADETKRARGGELGAVEYLIKPVEPEALVQAVENSLAK